jgi:hypothetical protein
MSFNIPVWYQTTSGDRDARRLSKGFAR